MPCAARHRGGHRPKNAFQLIQGLETLPLRLRQHNENAVKVADYLAGHPKVVARVIFPRFQTGEAGRRAARYLKPGHYGALVGFDSRAAAMPGRLSSKPETVLPPRNIGDARSLAIHPSTTTHSQLSADDQLATGVTPGYVRLSIGIEHPDDLIADLDQALSRA